eukprot:9473-Heterococcus_DN1.PRE.1
MHGLVFVCSAVLCSLAAATITCSSGWGERTKKQALEYTHAAFCANTSTCFEFIVPSASAMERLVPAWQWNAVYDTHFVRDCYGSWNTTATVPCAVGAVFTLPPSPDQAGTDATPIQGTITYCCGSEMCSGSVRTVAALLPA